MNMKTVGVYEYDESKSNQLGHGQFGVVYKGHKKTKLNEIVAIKKVCDNSCNKKEREIEILQALSNTTHRNIVKLLHYEQQTDDIYFVLEFCNGGSLQEYLESRRTLDERTISIFLKQIAAGLKIAHEMTIIHRDLKPDNILLHFSGPRYPSPDDITLKIADFGIGKILRSDEVARTNCGTLPYMAPEIIKQRRSGHDYKADLWSVGVIALQCFNGSLPEDYISFHGFKMPKSITPDLKKLLNGLLENDQSKRFTLKEFLNHPFLATTISVSVVGPGNEPKMIRVIDNQSVDHLIDTICSTYSTGSEDAYLIHEDRTLERGSGNSLVDSDIRNNTTVSFVKRLSGGGYVYDGQDAAHSSPYLIRTAYCNS